LDLPGGRRLAQIDPDGGPGDAAVVGDGDEGAQLMEVHRILPFCIDSIL
jgi:hypothetical protein